MAVAVAAASPPNIVWILADDLDARLLYASMDGGAAPNLSALRARGIHFQNHVAAQPVCGPSRSSLLQGRFPHNVGYYANEDPASVQNYVKVANNTVGTWLTAAGYHSAFIGKYVNGVESFIPQGWNFWGAFSTSKGTYNYYNATPWNITFDRAGKTPTSPIVDVPMTGIHQADFVGAWGVDQMKVAAAAGLPFFVHLTATMVHEGTCYGPFKDTSKYALDDPFWEADLSQGFGCTADNAQTCSITISPCPSDKHKHDFDGQTYPHLPNWNVSEAGNVPKVMAKNPALLPYEKGRQDMGFRNRSAAIEDLDDMIGVVLKGIDDLGVSASTWVIFTSDNGFHMGEHRMLFGKEHPYEHDTNLPMFVAGPGVVPNSTLLHPTNHLDITATVVELAGATATGPPLDGLSFASQLTAPGDPASWRDFSFIEYFENANTWQSIRRPLAGDRTVFTQWCQDNQEVFDLDADPYEINNLDGTSRGAAVEARDLPLAFTLGTCSGAACNQPSPGKPPKHPLACKNTTKGRGEGWW